ncbi:MAG: UDP-N-acetylmuramate dehydrogenase [Arenimonas sp.]|nr:UDP-N-acetylmuramate dehydrogenase [Arenimonas sp.]
MRHLHWAEDVSLAGRNTFHLQAKAMAMCDLTQLDDMQQVFDLAEAKQLPVLVIGEGSNILLAGDYPGLVLCITANQCSILEHNNEQALIRAEAGMLWNDLVHWTLARGWNGLENMALIPGTVGACPIQNIGAYGVEVSEFIETVEAYHRMTGRVKRLSNIDCEFAYRDSIFKQQRDEWVITAVEFRLHKNHPLKMNYAGVPEELAGMGIAEPKAVHLAEAISRIRSRKLPNPALLGNAGSFFKNPIVSNAFAEALKLSHPNAPVFAFGNDQHKKISAAWLIEQAGWKGFRQGDAGIAEQHALVLVNYGLATGQQLLELARQVVASVSDNFGITLEPEPRIIGADF